MEKERSLGESAEENSRWVGNVECLANVEEKEETSQVKLLQVEKKQ